MSIYIYISLCHIILKQTKNNYIKKSITLNLESFFFTFLWYLTDFPISQNATQGHFIEGSPAWIKTHACQDQKCLPLPVFSIVGCFRRQVVNLVQSLCIAGNCLEEKPRWPETMKMWRNAKFHPLEDGIWRPSETGRPQEFTESSTFFSLSLSLTLSLSLSLSLSLYIYIYIYMRVRKQIVIKTV